MAGKSASADKPDAAALEAARGRRVPDLVGPELAVLFVGINPSLYSACVGHHFARPGNRFWKTLHRAGFTPRLLAPHEEHELSALGIGITNVVPRATAAAAELQASDYVRGAAALRRKLARLSPRAVAFLGIDAYRRAARQPAASVGLQPEPFAGIATWVLPNPSGLNAHYQLDALAREYRRLRLWLERG